MKRGGIIAVFVISVVVSAIIIPCAINRAFLFRGTGIATSWNAEDALAYAGAVLGSISSVVLGYIAFTQNNQLQRMEDNNYIANNSSMLLIDSVDVNGKSNVPCNYWCHSEQMLRDYASTETAPVGYSFIMTGHWIGNAIPALVHITSCELFTGSDDGSNKLTNVFSFTNIENSFSRIAIFSQKIKFSMTLMMDANRKSEFEDAVKNRDNIMEAEFVFQIVTDKFVATSMKCRSSCKMEINPDRYSWKSDDPMVFFYGHTSLDKKNIRYSGRKEITHESSQNAHP